MHMARFLSFSDHGILQTGVLGVYAATYYVVGGAIIINYLDFMNITA